MAARIAVHSVAGHLGRLLRQGARLLYGAYVLLLSAAFVLPGWLLVLLGVPRGALSWIVHRGSRLYLALAGIPLEILGREGLRKREGPFIFVANHASYLDPVPLMAALEVDYAFAIKREARDWPVLGRILRRLEHVFVERENVEESASATGALQAALARGRSVILFPEATFARATGLRHFKLGAFQLAAETGAPLVPIALVGTRRLLRDGTWIPRRVPVTIDIGAPLVAENSFADVVRVKEEVAEILARRVGEPRLGV